MQEAIRKTISIFTYLPEIITFLTAITASVLSYLASAKRCKTEISALRESNNHEIERLMKQHEIDLSSLEREHELEMEKIKEEYRLKMEAQKAQQENQLGADLIHQVFEVAMNTPEAKQAMGTTMATAFKPSNNKTKRWR
ncbi:MAG: hypothetical protein E7335_11390 [Clostridiales bacterium]|nr:hypothetical protein [Clostridiales bacterium]